jgi:flagella basal body P-ring formation protein FlgA
VAIQKIMAEVVAAAQINRGTNITVTPPAMVTDRLPIQKIMAEVVAAAQIHRGTNITVTPPAMVTDRLPLPVHVVVMAKP